MHYIRQIIEALNIGLEQFYSFCRLATRETIVFETHFAS